MQHEAINNMAEVESPRWANVPATFHVSAGLFLSPLLGGSKHKIYEETMKASSALASRIHKTCP
jgi:hypothetical protein